MSRQTSCWWSRRDRWYFSRRTDAWTRRPVYVYADPPGDARAVCALRLREIVNGREFDETYTMEAEPNEHGLYRFVLERKYPDGHRSDDEELTLWEFQHAALGSADPDFFSELTVRFYDAGGNEVHTYEKALWNLQREE